MSSKPPAYWKRPKTDNRIRDGALLAARVSGLSVAEVMAQFNVSKASVNRICKLERIRQAIDRLVQSNRKGKSDGEEGRTKEARPEGEAGANKGRVGDGSDEETSAQPQEDR